MKDCKLQILNISLGAISAIIGIINRLVISIFLFLKKQITKICAVVKCALIFGFPKFLLLVNIICITLLRKTPYFLLLLFCILVIANGLNIIQYLQLPEFINNLTKSVGILTIYPEVKPIAPDTMKPLMNLVQKGYILTHDQLINTLASFYNTIIMFLLGTISVLGVLAYLSVRSLSLREAETMAQKEIDKELKRTLEDKEKFKSLLDNTGILEDIENATSNKNLAEIAQLKSKINALEHYIMSNTKE